MNPAVILGIQLAFTLLEGVSNITVAVTKMNASIRNARAQGRQISLEELLAIAQANRDLTDEVIALLEGD